MGSAIVDADDPVKSATGQTHTRSVKDLCATLRKIQGKRVPETVEFGGPSRGLEAKRDPVGTGIFKARVGETQTVE